MATTKLPKAYEDKAKKIQQAYNKFVAELESLKKKRRELVGQIIKRIDHDKIKKIMDSLK